MLAATIFVYAIFTGAAALSQTVWQLGLFRLLAGIGIGGEWALAGTYVAEAWPEDRRKMGAGYLQTGYYAGFFLASALNYTVAAHYGWRAMFWCGLTPVVVAFMVLLRVKEPERWQQKAKVKATGGLSSLRRIFSPPYTRRTLVNTVLLASAICGLWAGAVYAPTAIITLAKRAGMLQPQAVRMSSFGMGLLSLGTILGCLAVPPLAERFGRKRTLAFYFFGMAICILLSFGWAFYLPTGLHPFIAVLFFLGFFGGNFAVFSLWLPEQYGTTVRATAFAFTTSFGRFIAAGVNFGIGAMVSRHGNSRQAGGVHRDCLRHRPAGDSVRGGDPWQTVTRLKFWTADIRKRSEISGTLYRIPCTHLGRTQRSHKLRLIHKPAALFLASQAAGARQGS